MALADLWAEYEAAHRRLVGLHEAGDRLKDELDKVLDDRDRAEREGGAITESLAQAMLATQLPGCHSVTHELGVKGRVRAWQDPSGTYHVAYTHFPPTPEGNT